MLRKAMRWRWRTKGPAMSDDAPKTRGAPGFIRGPQDFWGGIALVAIALFVFWASSDLSGMRGFTFGPGTAPRLCASLLLVLGAAIAISGLLVDGNPLQHFAVRGPFFVTISIVIFALAIRPLGLVATSFICFMVAALGSPETRWIETAITGLILTVFCALLFPYGLGLRFQLWPAFVN
jgi:putative tricarboxylic transport membrane protein